MNVFYFEIVREVFRNLGCAFFNFTRVVRMSYSWVMSYFYRVERCCRGFFCELKMKSYSSREVACISCSKSQVVNDTYLVAYLDFFLVPFYLQRDFSRVGFIP